MSLPRPNLLVIKLIMNCSSVSFLCLISLKLTIQDANFDIFNAVAICIEMQWQRKKLFLSDSVCHYEICI